MTCQEVNELMQRHLDRELTPSEETVLRSHMLECPECAAMWERLELLNEELVQLPKVAPAISLVDAILPRLAEIDRLAASLGDHHESTVTSNRISWFKRIPWAAAGGVVAAGIVLGLFITNGDMMERRMADDSLPQARDNKIMMNVTSSSQEKALAADQTMVLKDHSGSNQSAAIAEAGEAPAAEPRALHIPEQPSVSQSAGGSELQSAAPPAQDQQRMSEAPTAKGLQASSAGAADTPRYSAQTDPGQQAPDAGPHGYAKTAPESEPVPSGQSIFGVTDLPLEVSPVELTSPEGAYVASVRAADGLILILQNGEAVYKSAVYSLEQVRLFLEHWESETKLIYRVEGNGEVLRYRIDLETGTETQIQ
jgi:hypothetical protein